MRDLHDISIGASTDVDSVGVDGRNVEGDSAEFEQVERVVRHRPPLLQAIPDVEQLGGQTEHQEQHSLAAPQLCTHLFS
jgi:hypothetical protein